MLRNNVLFKQGFRPNPITLESFMAMFDTNKNINNDENLIFLDPVRFRYHYMVEYIHSNRTHFAHIVDTEEQNYNEEQ